MPQTTSYSTQRCVKVRLNRLIDNKENQNDGLKILISSVVPLTRESRLLLGSEFC